MKKTFYIFNAGCIRRGVDCILIKQYLKINNYKELNSSRKADLIVVSTCGVVAKNEEYSLRAIKKAIKDKKDKAVVIITGCLSNINPAALKAIGDFVYIPNGELEKFDDVVEHNISINNIPYPDTIKDGGSIIDYLITRSFNRKSELYKKLFDKYSMNNLFLKISAVFFETISAIKKFLHLEAQRIVPYYNIKIADGCLSDCTFCATKFATKRLKSRPANEIIAEFKSGVEKGYSIFQLLSEDSGCYGLDIKTNITALLTELFKIQGDYKITLIDFNPIWLIRQKDELIPLLVKNCKKIKEIFLPFQSGSNKILDKMKREHTIEELQSCVKIINKEAPEINLRTSVLVGFPGETEEDFQDSVRFIRACNFAEVAVNRYEDRPLAESAQMTDKVESKIIENRAKYLVDNLNCKMLS